MALRIFLSSAQSGRREHPALCVAGKTRRGIQTARKVLAYQDVIRCGMRRPFDLGAGQRVRANTGCLSQWRAGDRAGDSSAVSFGAAANTLKSGGLIYGRPSIPALQ